MEQAATETPMLVTLGISVPTLLLGVLLFIAAKVYFFIRPKGIHYYSLHSAALFTCGWAIPAPIGVLLVCLAAISFAMGVRVFLLRRREQQSAPAT